MSGEINFAHSYQRGMVIVTIPCNGNFPTASNGVFMIKDSSFVLTR